MPAHKDLLRIVDANFNRAKEGLRVCEDICRFMWDNPILTKEFKNLRHYLTQAVEGVGILKAIGCRDIEGDVGRRTTARESKRSGIGDVFYANSQRVKESLRVLEEIFKLLDPKLSEQIKVIRYSFYALEKKSLTKR